MIFPHISLTRRIALLIAVSTCLAESVSVASSPILPKDRIKVQSPSLLQAQASDPRKTQANQLLKQGIQQFETKQPQAALNSWQQALTLFRQIADLFGEAKALNNIGYAYGSLENWDKAIVAYENALTIAQNSANDEIALSASANLGRAYDAISKPAQSLRAYQQALPLAQKLNNRPGEAAISGGIALAYELLKDYSQALQFYQRWLTLAAELGDSNSAAIAESSIARVQRLQQKSKLKLLPIFKSKTGADRLFSEGTEQFQKEQFQAAIPLFEKALKQYRVEQNREGEMQALVSLGNAYFHQEQFALAIESLESGLALSRSLKNQQREEQALRNLGIAYFNLGDFQTALTYTQQLLALTQQLNLSSEQLNVQGLLASIHTSLGDFSHAVIHAEQQVKLAQQAKEPYLEASALGILADVYLGLNQSDRAIAALQKSLKISTSSELTGVILGSLGKAYATKQDYQTALTYLRQSLESERKSGSLLGEAIALNNLGNTLFLTGQLSEAKTQLQEAMKTWETQRSRLGANDSFQISIFESQALTYRTLQQVLIASKEPQQALEVSERGRARAFVEFLKRRQNRDLLLPSTNLPTLQEIQQVARQQNATLVQYSIVYDNAKLFIPAGQDETRSNLAAALYIWVVQPTGKITFRQISLKSLPQSLNALVSNSRQTIGARSRAAIVPVPTVDRPAQTQQLQALHRLLIAPIADLLPRNERDRIIFIPQDELFLVPFSALQDADGKFLIEKHTILTAPSIQTLAFTRQKAQEQKKLPSDAPALVVGNPVMPTVSSLGNLPESLAPLPGAELEANNIATLLGTQPIIGKNASKKVIKQRMAAARLIHLATHGLLDDFKGLGIPGAIALAPDQTGQKNDGLLTADEILEMKLQAELVVLSACDTGRGRIVSDGVIGLSRSLILAGVPSVIVSLWKVPDQSTALLMTEFHKNLKQSSNKVQALRAAMLTTMKSSPDPIHWAAFTLIGEAK